MKKILFIIAVIFAVSPINAGIKLDIHDLTGDRVDVNFKFYSDSIFGARGDGLRMGGTVSTLDFDQSFTSYNPACLAFQKSAMASFSGIPFEILSSDVAGFIINRDLSADLVDAVKIDNGGGGGSTAMFSNGKLYAAQANGITGMEGMLPFADNNAAIGVAREEKLGIDMNLIAEGLKSSMSINDPSNPFYDLSLTVTAGAAAAVNIKSVVTSIGIGRKISPQWGIGAVLEYIDTKVSVDVSADANATGQDVVSGKTFEYNTNAQNSLAQYLKGGMEAAAWALRVGTSYHAPDDLAEVAVDFSIQPNFNFNGLITGMSHTLPTDSATILNDFNNGQTTTIEAPWSSAGTAVKLKLPSYFRATLAYKPGPVISLNYTRFFDNLTFSYDNKDMMGKFYLATTDILRIGLNFQYFQIGGGFAVGRMGSISDDKNDSKPAAVTDQTMPYPIGSLGFVVPMGSYLKTEVELVAFPLPVAKMSLTLSY